MIVEWYFIIGIVMFLWCYLIERDIPLNVIYAPIIVMLAWPIAVPIIYEDTIEAFK